ncbi:MAG: hypothetical protein JSV03_08880 [Planctomycetota bacterium]|nr:MAG: hypothetical protein JSV03_08880 [Planctomycetota bacterium]
MKHSMITLLAALLTALVNQGVAYAGGTVVTTELTSPALEGSILGTPATRQARVYLPPGYDTSDKPYPVLYYLHGAFGDEYTFESFAGHETADRLIGDGEMQEMIIVGVDGSGGQPLSSYVNSELNGNFEDYIVRDVVNHIDATFRTIGMRDGRGIFGASMGGYGAMRYAMIHADVFGAAYSISTGFPSFSRPESWLYLGEDEAVFLDTPNAGEDLAGVQTPSDFGEGVLRNAVFGWASAFSPNLDNPPLFVDLPFELPTLKTVPEVREKWLEYDPFTLLRDHASELSSLRGFALAVGDRDIARANLADSQAFHEALLDAGVPHQFEVFSGGHIGDERIERIGLAMIFLSESLVTSIRSIRDFNGDGVVDCADICLMVDHWHTDKLDYDIAPPPFGDGIVDVQDLIVLAEDLFTYPGTVAHWSLDETEGGTAYDSAADHVGTLIGDPAWQPAGGMVAGALQFDGTDDYVSTEFVLNPADGAFSIFAWIKGGAPGQAIISQANGFNWLCVDASEGNLMTELRYVSRGGSGAPLVSQTPIIDGDWHRVGLSWDGADRILYVDDVEIAGDTQPGMVSSRSGLYIGAGGSRGEGTFWSGLIDDIRIYNRAVRP